MLEVSQSETSCAGDDEVEDRPAKTEAAVGAPSCRRRPRRLRSCGRIAIVSAARSIASATFSRLSERGGLSGRPGRGLPSRRCGRGRGRSDRSLPFDKSGRTVDHGHPGALTNRAEQVRVPSGAPFAITFRMQSRSWVAGTDWKRRSWQRQRAGCSGFAVSPARGSSSWGSTNESTRSRVSFRPGRRWSARALP